MIPSRSVTAVLVLMLASVAVAQEPSPPTPDSPAGHVGYIGADACKDCHADIWKAWQSTKHAGTLDRLAETERAKPECLSCHVTGTPEAIAAEGHRPSFPGAQCESCHGPAKKHVEAAQANQKDPKLKGLVKKEVPAKECEKCHNAKSPHYKGFFYGPMKPLVHKIRATK